MISWKEPVRVWVIERADTGERLGSRDRTNAGELTFGARVPHMWQSLKSAREGWVRHAVAEGYLKKAISLAGRPGRYDPGSNFAVMPPVTAVEMELRPVGSAVLPCPTEGASNVL